MRIRVAFVIGQRGTPTRMLVGSVRTTLLQILSQPSLSPEGFCRGNHSQTWTAKESEVFTLDFTEEQMCRSREAGNHHALPSPCLRGRDHALISFYSCLGRQKLWDSFKMNHDGTAGSLFLDFEKVKEYHQPLQLVHRINGHDFKEGNSLINQDERCRGPEGSIPSFNKLAVQNLA